MASNEELIDEIKSLEEKESADEDPQDLPGTPEVKITKKQQEQQDFEAFYATQKQTKYDTDTSDNVNYIEDSI